MLEFTEIVYGVDLTKREAGKVTLKWIYEMLGNAELPCYTETADGKNPPFDDFLNDASTYILLHRQYQISFFIDKAGAKEFAELYNIPFED